MISWNQAQIRNKEEYLSDIADNLDNLTLFFILSLHINSNMIGYLRSTVLGKNWTKRSLKNIYTVEPNFDQMITALNKRQSVWTKNER